jgi:hypothetical protein
MGFAQQRLTIEVAEASVSSINSLRLFTRDELEIDQSGASQMLMDVPFSGAGAATCPATSGALRRAWYAERSP